MRDKLKEMDIPKEYLDVKLWEPVEISNLSDKELNDFLRKKEAIDLYFMTNIPIKEICESCNISTRALYILVERCLTLKSSGNIYGYSAILPYARIKSSHRKFNTFIAQHNELHELMLKKFKAYQVKHTPNFKSIHRSFLRWCYQNDIKENEYPFTLSDKGYRSLLRYYNDWLKNQDFIKEGEVTKIAFEKLPQTSLTPLTEVEIDGHRIDAYFITEFQTPSGTWREAVIERPWILCTIDRSTRCILGFELVLKSEYDSMDLLSCIEKSIIPTDDEDLSKDKEFDINFLPNQLFPDVEYALFDELYLDNAKAHLADSVLNTLVKKLGVKVCFGKVAEPTRRAIIERFFKTLEERSFHELPSTTGISPIDPRRHFPEKQAKRYRISVDDLKRITFSAIAEYNNTPHSSLYGNSPLEDFRQKINNRLYTYLPVSLRDGSDFHIIKDSRTVVANNKINYLHINFAGAKYTSSKLTNDKAMLREKLLLQINFKDIRVIKAFYASGEYYDDLFVEKKWRGRKHNLKERKLINKLSREGQFSQLNQLNILETYDNYLFNKTVVDKKTGSKIAELQNRQDNFLDDDPSIKSSIDTNNTTPSDNKQDDELKTHRRLRTKPIEIKGLNL